MGCLTVDILQQRQKFLCEHDVVMRTAKSTLSPKLFERDSAVGTNFMIQFFLDCGITIGVRVDRCIGLGRLRMVQIFLRATLTQVQSLHVSLTQFSDV